MMLTRDDIFVLLSESEGVPFAAQEAMYLGLPGVVSDLPGLRWLGGDAFLYVTSVFEASQAIRNLLEDESERHKRGAMAAAQVRRLLKPEYPWADLEKRFLQHMSKGGV